MKKSLAIAALFIVPSLADANCSLSCAEGELLGTNCLGDCPAGYIEAAESGYSMPSDGYNVYVAPYCWQLCHGDVAESLVDIKTCGKPTAYGFYRTQKHIQIGPSSNDYPLFYDEASCAAKGLSDAGCEFCANAGADRGFWVPKNDCGAPSCSFLCPVTCPADMEQQDDFTCLKASMPRPVIGTAKCVSDEMMPNPFLSI